MPVGVWMVCWTVAPFAIGRFAVTNAEWQCFMDSGGYEDERWWDTADGLSWRRGEITAGGRQPDQASPFTPPTTSGDTRTFTLATPGVYGYYCDSHWFLSMWGAVVVVP